jgi:hypothetical protein
MRKTSEIVAEVVADSVVLQTQLTDTTSNLSALARKIHSSVEKRAKRQIKQGTITVALHRLRRSSTFSTPPAPVFSFDDCLVHTSLTEIVFQKTPELLLKLQVVNRHFLQKGHFITVVQGINEVSLITLTKQIPMLLNDLFLFKILLRLDHLTNITLKVSSSYTTTPGIFHVLLGSLAAKRINIVEVFTTSTEISLLVHQNDTQTILKLLTS